jgi:hypothetical protein
MENQPELSQWDDSPPPMIEEEEMDVLAFQLWQRASRVVLAAAEDYSQTEETVASHASCL